MKYISVAIDGPSGAGKSTISKILAKELSYIYVDTGALYRAIGLYVYNKKIEPTDKNSVVSLLPEINIEIKLIDNNQHVFLNNIDVSSDIRQHEISKYASDVSAIPEVREFLLSLQRSFAKTNNIIMDGRDIGTVILPNADVKIYLTATPEDRATRRYEELKEKGQNVDFEQILSDVKQRDFNDMNREIAPLKPAPDAILVDTTGNSLEESVSVLKKIILEKLNVI